MVIEFLFCTGEESCSQWNNKPHQVTINNDTQLALGVVWKKINCHEKLNLINCDYMLQTILVKDKDTLQPWKMSLNASSAWPMKPTWRQQQEFCCHRWLIIQSTNNKQSITTGSMYWLGVDSEQIYNKANMSESMSVHSQIKHDSTNAESRSSPYGNSGVFL